MLVHLRIRNLAIIDAVDLDFPPGFTVVTGETGAGKSILVTALGLVLGARASTDIVRAGAANAEAEALFDIAGHPVIAARLEQRDLVGDDPGLLLVRRVVARKGRGKVLVNGKLATVATLAEIVRGLVDISGQHEQQSLLVVDNHIDILDAYGEIDPEKAAYRTAYDALLAAWRERDRLQRGEEENLRRADFLRFQLDEIDRIGPTEGEDESLQSERRMLAHAEKLEQGARLAEGLLYGDDGSAFDKVGKAVAEIEALSRIDGSLSPVCEGLEVARREIEEAGRTMQRYAERVESDPARLEDVEARLSALGHLTRKHGKSVGEVIKRAQELRRELDSLDNADARLAELGSEIRRLEDAALAAAVRLSRARQAAARRLEEAVEAEISEMDLVGAVFRVGFEDREDPVEGGPVEGKRLGPQGLDGVELLWSANPGEPPRPLAKIASGGELSRLMLAVKSVLASRDLVSLYVFDEVDTGLGGRAADRIGRKIRRVAQDHQAVTVTHLAPIAARADHHLRVVKVSHGERTVSTFEIVDGDTRAEEIARMIDGAGTTMTTQQAAHEMLSRVED